MNQDDFGILKWVAGSLGALISGVVAGTWTAASRTKDYESRLAVLERSWERQAAFCREQQIHITTDLTERLCASFKDMMKDETIRQAEILGKINTNIALINQSHETMKDDVTEIFARLNKRRPTPNERDTGERRRYTDYQE